MDPGARARTTDVEQQLAGFETWMEQLVRDWNVPGIGVGVVVKDELVFAKGWGFRDHGKKLPFTATTVVPIASNTKLFTATAVGYLVEEGRLEIDKALLSLDESQRPLRGDRPVGGIHLHQEVETEPSRNPLRSTRAGDQNGSSFGYSAATCAS